MEAFLPGWFVRYRDVQVASVWFVTTSVAPQVVFAVERNTLSLSACVAVLTGEDDGLVALHEVGLVLVDRALVV